MSADASTLTRRTFLKRGLLALPALMVGASDLCAASEIRSASSYGLAFISEQLPLIRRSQWARAPSLDGRLQRAGYYTRITVHHTGTSVNVHTARSLIVRDLNSVLQAHLQLRYGDIGYHFAVDYTGQVWECRPLAYEGAHVSGENEANVGVVLLGNFEKQRSSMDQLLAMRQLVALVQQRFRIPARRTYGHRDLGQTLCPGRYLYPHVVQIRTA